MSKRQDPALLGVGRGAMLQPSSSEHSSQPRWGRAVGLRVLCPAEELRGLDAHPAWISDVSRVRSLLLPACWERSCPCHPGGDGGIRSLGAGQGENKELKEVPLCGK